MNIDAIAAQIRTVATAFNGNVAGGAAYANSIADQVWLPLPAAYVIPGDEDADPNESMTGSYQLVRERVSVIIVAATMSAGGSLDPVDRRGQAAAAQVDVLRAAVFKAILNWRPDEDGGDTITSPSARGLYYVAGRFIDMDRARFKYEYVFGLDTTITDDDGWRPTGTPLTKVVGTFTDQISGETLTIADATP